MEAGPIILDISDMAAVMKFEKSAVSRSSPTFSTYLSAPHSYLLGNQAILKYEMASCITPLVPYVGAALVHTHKSLHRDAHRRQPKFAVPPTHGDQAYPSTRTLVAVAACVNQGS
ncbi:hypothetical protein SCLCIDRAFT_173536 [Scleroderma citrinum Foug A]|uniref:Uncharacterized protein n=1 Tax=Scleroderma citrinum Foug A TaxID=1036808 RepID=A0A0C3B0R9_9AGAM|nr:hypothetical protein SCLCIDRAFT_173536 [Scleroderma citrinum Foug A]